LFEGEDELGHAVGDDVPVFDRGPIQTGSLQPGIDEPRERVPMAGAAFGHRDWYCGGEVRRQPGEPLTFFVDLGFCPVDPGQPYAEAVSQPIDGIVRPAIRDSAQSLVSPVRELILE
jgi:hypothetical protein